MSHPAPSDARPSCQGIDLDLVAWLVRTAGLACETYRARAGALVRAGTAHRWTATLSSDHTGRLYLGPEDADESVPARLASRDERQIAALIVAQARLRDPGRALSSDEIGALGLAGMLVPADASGFGWSG
ncbi:hypothetical protein [Pseudonocardia acaciae]|uniref:hypothetical protein n=1 Tax=Pseudonocardia acaciae TaxID=551276 RepID=UPI00048E4898|nr:hypothetical protein [Pseudonocardia acaciae]